MNKQQYNHTNKTKNPYPPHPLTHLLPPSLSPLPPPGIKDQGSGNVFKNNLVSVMLFPGTYGGRWEPENRDWHAGFDLEDASGTVLRGNVVAGKVLWLPSVSRSWMSVCMCREVDKEKVREIER